MKVTRADFTWGITRIALGFVFLWPFFDKLFGLGFSTIPSKSWLAGGSPTYGYLSNIAGPLASFYHALAPSQIVTWLFMIGLLLIGASLILGVFTRLACISGALMLILMWGASWPIKTNPFLDDHVIYALVLIGLMFARAGQHLGLGRWWSRTKLVRNVPFFE